MERVSPMVALYPGSFDPFHNGHKEIVERAARIFDKVVIAALRNPQKSDPLFSLEERRDMISESLVGLNNVEIVGVSTLVINVAREVGAKVIVRGLRAVSDFENELQMAQMNYELAGIDTVFIPTGAETAFVASRLIKEIARFGGDVSPFVPEPVAKRMREKFGLTTP